MSDDLERGLEILRERAEAYQTVFLGHGKATDIVLKDLSRICRAHESTFHVEHSISDRLDGRREVWLRISQHLYLDERQLWDIYGNKSVLGNPPEE